MGNFHVILHTTYAIFFQVHAFCFFCDFLWFLTQLYNDKYLSYQHFSSKRWNVFKLREAVSENVAKIFFYWESFEACVFKEENKSCMWLYVLKILKTVEFKWIKESNQIKNYQSDSNEVLNDRNTICVSSRQEIWWRLSRNMCDKMNSFKHVISLNAL